MRRGRLLGRIVVGSISLFLLVLVIGVLEFQYGMIQKTVYSSKVRHYLEQTYNEPMVIKKVTYLWDNIEPISARVHPKSSSNLEFSVYPSKDTPTGYRDDYAETLWVYQVKEDVEHRLLNIDSDLKSQPFIDFTCCAEIKDQMKVVEGTIPSYTQSNLQFDLIFQLERALQKNDLEQMFHILTALKPYEQPRFGIILFLLQPEDKSYRVEYKIPGAKLKDIHTIEDLKPFNESRLPARELAERIEAEISWDASNSRVVFSKGDTVLELKHWGEEVLLNGVLLPDALPSFLGEQGNLLVPVGLLEKAFQVEIPLIE
ncbi:stalk domain-containing protein [Paenibacillus solani]|uniref:stalk domain-containing protein n=1 Tax=Paenibacillus solani TaxID=1705565 RepID=UPI003D2DEB2A